MTKPQQLELFPVLPVCVRPRELGNIVQMPKRVRVREQGGQVTTMTWEGMLTYLSERVICDLPEDERAAARASFRTQVLHAPSDEP